MWSVKKLKQYESKISSFNRTLCIGDILIPKVKDMNIVAKILTMARDIEYTKYSKRMAVIEKNLRDYEPLWEVILRKLSFDKKHGFYDYHKRYDDAPHIVWVKHYFNGKEHKYEYVVPEDKIESETSYY